MTDTDPSPGYSRRHVLQGVTTLGTLVAGGTARAATASTSPQRGFGADGYGARGYGRSTPTRVARFDRNGTPGIQRSEVVAAIEAYNGQDRVGGRPVTADDVMAVLAAYNG